MSVTVTVHGILRSVLGESRLEADMAGSSVGDLINALVVRYGDEVKQELLDHNGNLDYAYLIFLDGRPVRCLSQEVKDGDEIVITTTIAGG